MERVSTLDFSRQSNKIKSHIFYVSAFGEVSHSSDIDLYSDFES